MEARSRSVDSTPRPEPRGERRESGWADLDPRAAGFLLSLYDLFCTSCHNAHQCIVP